MAASEKDIENIIKMLDEASATTARINLNVAEDGNDGEIRKLSITADVMWEVHGQQGK